MAHVLRGDQLNREIDEEFEAHVEEAVAEGRDPAEVRRAFGSMLLIDKAMNSSYHSLGSRAKRFNGLSIHIACQLILLLGGFGKTIQAR
jgi:hypothetical protein